MISLDVLKENLIKLVELHKESCEDPECPVSTTLIGELLIKAGCKITSEEWDRIL